MWRRAGLPLRCNHPPDSSPLVLPVPHRRRWLVGATGYGRPACRRFTGTNTDRPAEAVVRCPGLSSALVQPRLCGRRQILIAEGVHDAHLADQGDVIPDCSRRQVQAEVAV